MGSAVLNIATEGAILRQVIRIRLLSEAGLKQ